MNKQNSFIKMESIKKTLKENKNKEISLMQKENTLFLNSLVNQIDNPNSEKTKIFIENLVKISNDLTNKAMNESCSNIGFNIFLYSLFETLIDFQLTNKKISLETLKAKVKNAKNEIIDLLFIFKQNEFINKNNKTYEIFSSYARREIWKEDNEFSFFLLNKEEKLIIKTFFL